MKPLNTIFLALAVLLVTGIDQCQAQVDISFGPKDTKIDGSIHYSVIGRYLARFKVFKGSISLDNNLKKISSVDLEIKTNSITSNCSWCDNIVRSTRLLDTSRYPEIIFKSSVITHDQDGYKVKGILQMHGLSKEMVFPFSADIIDGAKLNKTMVDLKGSWVIDRKEFKIVWNDLLDHGGVLVGDDIIVNWRIREYL